MPAAFLIYLVGIILEQRLAETVDAAQRGAQIMRQGIAERLKLAIGCFGGSLGLEQSVVGEDQPSK
jgi:hypothetical protein